MGQRISRILGVDTETVQAVPIDLTINRGPEILKIAEAGDRKKVAELLEAGADFVSADRDGVTALLAASMNGHADVVEALLAAKLPPSTPRHAFVDSADVAGKTALMMAAGNGHVDATKALLAGGASVKLADQAGKTALHWAANVGQTATVEILIDWGSDLKVVDMFGSTPAALAAEKGHTAVAELFFEKMEGKGVVSTI